MIVSWPWLMILRFWEPFSFRDGDISNFRLDQIVVPHSCLIIRHKWGPLWFCNGDSLLRSYSLLFDLISAHARIGLNPFLRVRSWDGVFSFWNCLLGFICAWAWSIHFRINRTSQWFWNDRMKISFPSVIVGILKLNQKLHLEDLGGCSHWMSTSLIFQSNTFLPFWTQ